MGNLILHVVSFPIDATISDDFPESLDALKSTQSILGYGSLQRISSVRSPNHLLETSEGQIWSISWVRLWLSLIT